MEGHHHHFYPLLIIVIAAIVILASFLVITPRFIGKVIVTGVGGQMTSLNIQGSVGALSWMGLYGNLTNSTGNMTVNLVGGLVMPLNLTYTSPISNETVIIASLTSTPNWNSVTPASHALINTFLGLGPGDSQSSENTLMDRMNISLGGITHEVWSVTLLGVNGSYTVGALQSEGHLLFITQAQEDSTGFQGVLTEYELLLPIPLSGNASYFFFVFEQDNPPTAGNGTFNCTTQVSFTAQLAQDNNSVFIEWDSVPGAVSYELRYIDGPSEGYMNFSTPAIVALGSDLNWTDMNPSAERYYRLIISDGSSTCVSLNTVGTKSYPLSPDYNLFTTPFFFVNDSIPEVLRSIDGNYFTLFEYNNLLRTYNFYAIIGNNIFKTFSTIKPAKGYWILVNAPVNLRLIGTLAQNISEPLLTDYNLLGFPIISNVDQNESVPYVLSSIEGNYTTLFEYDNVLKTYNFYAIIGNNIFKTFTTIKPGRGYWIALTANETIMYTNSG
jgi:hypothetical protein